MTWQQALILFFASALAGAVNSVAGGGTLITFPSLIWVGMTEKIANATSTVALWPGQLSSLLGYRKEIGESRDAILRLAVPSLLGGGLGAYLLLHTPNAVFAGLVPWLILLATGLFMAQEPLARAQRARIEQAREEAAQSGAVFTETEKPPAAWAAVIGFQFLVA